MNEHGLLELQERRRKLFQLKQTLDSDAPMNTEEGFWYAETLVKMVVVELQIEALQKKRPLNKEATKEKHVAIILTESLKIHKREAVISFASLFHCQIKKGRLTMDAMEMYKFKLLLASSLREKPESYLVEELLNRYTDKAGLMNLTENELLEIKGIGKAKAKQIVSVFELSRMLMKVPTSNRYTIRSPQDAADLLIPEIGHLQHEVFA